MISWKKAGLAAGLLCAMAICTACGDTYRPIANPIITPGGDPQPINYAYILFTNPNGPGGVPGPGMLEQIDVSGDEVTLDVPVGHNPLFASFLGTGTGQIFTANEQDGTLTEQSFFSVQPPSQITLPLGSTPVSMGGNQASTLYILDTNVPGICTNGGVNVMTVASVIEDTICVGRNPVAVTQIPNGGLVYVVNQGDNTVSVIDPVSLVVNTTIPVGTNPVWASVNKDGSYVFVVNKGSGTLTVIHTTDNSTTTIPTGAPAFAGKSAPNFSIFDARRNRLYVTNGGSNDVTVLDLSGTAPVVLVQSVALGKGAANPTSVVPLADGSRYYVANTTSNNVTVIDGSSNTLSATATTNPIPLGPAAMTTQPLWIESEPTSTKVYVTTPAPTAATTANPNAAPGVTIIRTDTNAIANFQQAPQADPNCQVNPVTHTTCAYQIPLQILTYVHN